MAAGVAATDADALFFIDADCTGLTSAHLDEICEPFLAGRCTMSLGAFDYGWFWNPLVLRWPPLTGERIVPRWVFESIPPDKLQRLHDRGPHQRGHRREPAVDRGPHDARRLPPHQAGQARADPRPSGHLGHVHGSVRPAEAGRGPVADVLVLPPRPHGASPPETAVGRATGGVGQRAGPVSRCDVVVIGAGAMGSATAWWLARRGHDTVLLERFEPGHVRGSSHGASRIFRLAYDDPRYVRMGRDALALWRELEDDAGEPLLVTTGGVDHGDPAALAGIEAALAQEAVAHQLSAGGGGQRRGGRGCASPAR